MRAYDELKYWLIDYITELFRFGEMESAVRAEFYNNDGHSLLRRASDMITEQLYLDIDVPEANDE